MNIIGEFYENNDDLFKLISSSKPNFNSTFQVLTINEEAGWAKIILKINDSEINIKYSSCMFDHSLLTEFLSQIIDLKEEVLLILDNEGSEPMLYAEPNDTNTIRLLFASDYEIFNAFCRDEINNYNLADFKVEFDIIINKKNLLEEFYKNLYPFAINYDFKEVYDPAFNQSKSLKYLTEIKKFLNQHII